MCNQTNGMWDLLDIDYINSLPQPLWDDGWPVYDIDVQSGAYRIDVCGLLEVRHISGCLGMIDSTGKYHYSEDFYLDPECWIKRENVSKYNGEILCGIINLMNLMEKLDGYKQFPKKKFGKNTIHIGMKKWLKSLEKMLLILIIHSKTVLKIF